jgi:membrane protease YdiL (CAAX protease family)
MSIYPAAAIAPAQQLQLPASLLWPLLLAPAGLIIAWFLGVMRERSVEGPLRLEPREPLGRLWVVTCFGVFVWIMVPALVAQIAYSPPPTTAPVTTTATTTSTNPLSDLPPDQKLKMYILGQLCAVAALLLGNIATSPTALQRLGLTPHLAARGIFYGLLGALAAIPLTIGISSLVQIVLQELGRPAPQDHELIQVFRAAPTDVRRLVILSAALLAPVFEEILFRGHVQTALAATLAAVARPRFDDVATLVRAPSARTRWLAIALVSVLFASVHGLNWMFAPLYVLSLCLGYAYERTGNLWVPIAMHATFNIFSLVMAMLSP